LHLPGHTSFAPAPIFTDMSQWLLPHPLASPSHSQVQVAMHLLLPSRHDDLFQLSGELRSQQGEILAKASRTHMTPPRNRLQHLVRYAVHPGQD
jgi:hypothetical protein